MSDPHDANKIQNKIVWVIGILFVGMLVALFIGAQIQKAEPRDCMLYDPRDDTCSMYAPE